jgi:hypothetical protein
LCLIRSRRDFEKGNPGDVNPMRALKRWTDLIGFEEWLSCSAVAWKQNSFGALEGNDRSFCDSECAPQFRIPFPNAEQTHFSIWQDDIMFSGECEWWEWNWLASWVSSPQHCDVGTEKCHRLWFWLKKEPKINALWTWLSWEQTHSLSGTSQSQPEWCSRDCHPSRNDASVDKRSKNERTMSAEIARKALSGMISCLVSVMHHAPIEIPNANLLSPAVCLVQFRSWLNSNRHC